MIEAPAGAKPARGGLPRAPALLGRRRPPATLLVAGLLVGAAAMLPAAYLVIVIADDLGPALEVAFSSETAALAARTLGLAVAVTAAAAAIAVPIAWLTVRTDLPARRAWATLLTLPLVIPSYVGAYLFVAALGPSGMLQEALGVSQLPSIYGFGGAWLVLTLFTYPLILLPVRAALIRLDPQLEDAARAMGRGPGETFRSVVMPAALAGDRGRGNAGRALRAQRLRRRLDHALRLVHQRDLPDLQVELRPHGDRGAGSGAGRSHAALRLDQLAGSRVARGAPARPGLGPARASLSRSGAGAGRRSASARRSPWSHWCSPSRCSSTGPRRGSPPARRRRGWRPAWPPTR